MPYQIQERRQAPTTPLKRRMSQTLAELWAREIIFDTLSLRASNWQDAKKRASIFRIYDLAESPNTGQSRRVGGIRVESYNVPFKRWVRETLASEIAQAEKWEPRHRAARELKTHLDALDAEGLAEELRTLINPDFTDLPADVAAALGEEAANEPDEDEGAKYEPPPVRDDLVGDVVAIIGEDALKTRLLAYEVAVGRTITNAMRNLFTEPEDGDPAQGIADRLLNDWIRGVDWMATNLVDGFILTGSAGVLGELHSVVREGLPDFVVLEGEQVGRRKVWNHAHVFEIKGNNPRMTPAQERAAAASERCKRVDYHLLRFHLDYDIRDALLQVQSYGRTELFADDRGKPER